jgi:hypothetical protein
MSTGPIRIVIDERRTLVLREEFDGAYVGSKGEDNVSMLNVAEHVPARAYRVRIWPSARARARPELIEYFPSIADAGLWIAEQIRERNPAPASAADGEGSRA